MRPLRSRARDILPAISGELDIKLIGWRSEEYTTVEAIRNVGAALRVRSTQCATYQATRMRTRVPQTRDVRGLSERWMRGAAVRLCMRFFASHQNPEWTAVTPILGLLGLFCLAELHQLQTCTSQRDVILLCGFTNSFNVIKCIYRTIGYTCIQHRRNYWRRGVDDGEETASKSISVSHPESSKCLSEVIQPKLDILQPLPHPQKRDALPSSSRILRHEFL